jgi:hypothetical protein
MDHKLLISVLLPVALIARVILDLVSVGTGYRLDFAYFVVFLVAGIAILLGNPGARWGLLAVAIAVFYLGKFCFRRFRSSQAVPGNDQSK